MKIAISKIMNISNVLGNAHINSNDAFSAWVKRFFVYADAEIEVWNKLSTKERAQIANEKIELPLLELQAEQVPDNLPISAYEILEDIVKGELKKRKSQIEQLLDKKKESKKK